MIIQWNLSNLDTNGTNFNTEASLVQRLIYSQMLVLQASRINFFPMSPQVLWSSWHVITSISMPARVAIHISFPCHAYIFSRACGHAKKFGWLERLHKCSRRKCPVNGEGVLIKKFHCIHKTANIIV